MESGGKIDGWKPMEEWKGQNRIEIWRRLCFWLGMEKGEEAFLVGERWQNDEQIYRSQAETGSSNFFGASRSLQFLGWVLEMEGNEMVKMEVNEWERELGMVGWRFE